MRNFNSLDWWFWRCRFEDCQIGLTNIYGAGNFHAYESVFLRSREADIVIRNTGFFGVRDNLSVGSKAFYVAQAVGAGAQQTLQRNRVFDTQGRFGDPGGEPRTLILLDNTIVSRPGQAGPAVDARAAIGLTIGDRCSASQGVALKPGSTVLDQTRIARPGQPPAVPPPIATPRRLSAPIVTINPGVGAIAIQAQIDALVRRGGGAMWFAPGDHPIDRTLVLPAGIDLTLVGDGISAAARLLWKGAGEGPMLQLRGPSRVRIQDLSLDGGGLANGVEMSDVDREGGPVWLDQTKAQGCLTAGYQFERLARARRWC